MTETFNTNHALEIEILSPVHIGAGKEKDWFKGVDYVQEGDEIRLLNKDHLFNPDVLDRKEFNTLLTYLEQNNHQKLYKFLDDYFDWKEITLRSFYIQNENPTEIKSLIRNGNGTPYLPGSSIKGALRSVLFRYLHRHTVPNRQDDRLENELLGTFDRSLSRYLRPSDAEPIDGDVSALYNLRLYNLYGRRDNVGWEGDLKNNLPITAEHFHPGTRFKMRLSIADGLLRFMRGAEKRNPKDQLTPTFGAQIFDNSDPLGFLFQIINAHAVQYLDQEIEFFEKFDLQHLAASYIRQLQNLRKIAAEQKDQCILRLGAGSGFHSITGNWRFPDHIETVFNPDNRNPTWSASARARLPARYKSRKVLPQNGMLPGFIVIRLEGAARIALPEPVAAESHPETTALPMVQEEKPTLQRSTATRQDISLENIKDSETVFTAQVIAVAGSDIQVMLFIAGQNLSAKMTLGPYKKVYSVEVNDIVHVKVANRNKEGRIMQVSFVP